MNGKMAAPGIEQRVPAGARLVVDASVLIAHIMGSEATSAVATELLDRFVAGGRNEGVISALTLSEAMVRPSRVGGAREIGLGVLDMPGLTVRSVDLLVAAEAARIRSGSSVRLPDAVVIATGVLTSCDVLVTNDGRLAAAVPQVVPEMQVCLLSDLV
jgi:predicted nucleic acid-binding protein